MNLALILGAAALLQQPATQQAPATFQGNTTPPSGDTTGYWQQHVTYTITATLNEEQGKLQSTGRLVYKNNSPDTLREMYFHQYLNAFRPNSKWSAVDARENRVRFQYLGDNDIGYERFTQAPTYDGTPVIIDYPGAPDSTVVHFRLPNPLAPGDSATISFAWDARPSTVPRRQARRGRTYDFAQWFPKVAVYDRGGWEPNPFVPAGELYGEYGTYDVTMIVKDDQVVVGTGVPVEGDPGWERVSRNGKPYLASDAYGQQTAPLPSAPSGYRAVRFLAKDVHHFAWSASPDYRYEGGVYVRRNPPTHWKTWDTVAVHVLYKAGDDTTWGGGRALERTITAAKWLESLWGPYAYPQISNVHRIDPGGTEFPMMVMNGSASQGLILHEFGHVFSYGILGNNEWRSGWMDEGLTDYQSQWAQKLTPQDLDKIVSPPRLPEGYRVNGSAIPPKDSVYLSQLRLEMLGRSQPIGTPSYDFTEFGIYNDMIYNRAALMYGQLRELMGDSTFLRFTHDYYSRWALKHVDERAMQASAERAYGKPLGWFFDQWVHRTGLMDYALPKYSLYQDAGGYHTVIHLERNGELRHPMPVGVRTSQGWTLGRGDALNDDAPITITTTERPLEVAIDPYHETFDWDWRNNELPATLLGVIKEPKVTFNWPYLAQSDREHTLVALSPDAWYSNPQGAVFGVRMKTSYLSNIDKYDAGIGFASRSPTSATGGQPNILTRTQVWARGENLYLPGMSRPAMGFGGDVNFLDGLFKADLYKKWDLSPFISTPGPKIDAKVWATVSTPSNELLLPEQWSNTGVFEIGGGGSYRSTVVAPDSEYMLARASVAGGGATGDGNSRAYMRAEASVAGVRALAGTGSQLKMRLYGGIAPNAPLQRKIFASTDDPLTTFNDDLFRARGALLKQTNVDFLPLGGAGVRGAGVAAPFDVIGALNAEVDQRLVATKGAWGNATVTFDIFGDIAAGRSRDYSPTGASELVDAGAGFGMKGRFYDRDFNLRLDAPVFVDNAAYAWRPIGGGNGSIAPRWVITVGSLW